MARLAVYGAISAILAGGVIASAFAQRSNFYAACIYLYQSNACMMVILNLGMFLTIIAGQLVQMMFFGNLRTLEVEHLYERAWYAVTETCLAMTIFKDEFHTLFVVMFTFLLFLKVFHWLCQDRVDSMEQSPEIPMSFHVRMVTMIALLVTVDMLMILHAVEEVMTKKPGMMIMFGFEYTLLVTNLMASFGKYVLHTIDMRREEPWENKSMLLFYLDLVADFVKLVTYLIFFTVILYTCGLPLHIIRDVYMTMRSFIQKCKDLIQYRKATQNMNERYPDASAAELSALSDPICIICREEMVGNTPAPQEHTLAPNPPAEPAPRPGSSTTVPKKLPCGHIFHFHCLKSWLERQQSCPTCRRLVLDPPTPASTPMPAPGADAAGAGANNGAAPAGPGAAGQPPQMFPGQGNQMGGFPMVYAPQGHYPLAGWHPHVLGGAQGAGAGVGAAAGAAFPGAIPNDGATGVTTNTGASAGTTPTPVEAGVGGQGGVGIAPGVQIPGAMPWAHANYIPHYSIPHATHPIPGLIPLFPVQARPAGDGVPEADGGNGIPIGASTPLATSIPDYAQSLSAEQIPLTSLDALSESQLVYLEQNTRRALQERLRILQAVESQIIQSMTLLTQAIGALPPAPPPPPFAEELSTADPPSPQMAPHSSETTASRTSVFGSNMAGSSMSPSSVGLQSLTRGLNPSSLSGSNSGSGAESMSTSASPFPPTAQSSNMSSGVDGQSSDTKEEEESSLRVDKGKGKKKELDISAEEQAANQNGMLSSEDDIEMMDVDDDEDGKYPPQEMVRRRWAKISVADTEASLQ
ncbi:E3 ubiquitin-protein ligase hrd1 [Podila clonocystis]|nr:E3 ubiquitin-protein ligase hrd1 [Podila clonocystis]